VRLGIVSLNITHKHFQWFRTNRRTDRLTWKLLVLCSWCKMNEKASWNKPLEHTGYYRYAILSKKHSAFCPSSVLRVTVIPVQSQSITTVPSQLYQTVATSNNLALAFRRVSSALRCPLDRDSQNPEHREAPQGQTSPQSSTRQPCNTLG